MKVPISYALSYPERISSGVSGINLALNEDLQFEVPDLEKFRCLKLAYECLEKGGSYPIEINATNEIAVEAFLNSKIKFTQIAEIIEIALNQADNSTIETIEDILEVDKLARIKAKNLLEGQKFA